MSMTETWLPIPGYVGTYEASDLGQIRSVPRGRWKGRIRKQTDHPSGYTSVCLSLEGKHKTHFVYRLVALTFLGPRPEGQHTCHNDGDGRNSSVSNLRYDTPRENNLDTLRHGHHTAASKTHCLRGHRLEAPNLRPAAPARNCLACARARLYVNKHPECDLQVEADKQYSRIAPTEWQEG